MSAVLELVLALAVGLGVAILVQTIPRRPLRPTPRIGHHADGKP